MPQQRVPQEVIAGRAPESAAAGTAISSFYSRHAQLIGRMLRFAVVGVFVTGSYSVSTYAGIRWLRMAPLSASLLGCAASIVVSYIGQKYFTFRSDGAHRIELPKFLMACTAAVVGSSASMIVVTDTKLDFRIGILISALVLPLCNFTVMNLWVFSHTRRPSGDSGERCD